MIISGGMTIAGGTSIVSPPASVPITFKWIFGETSYNQPPETTLSTAVAYRANNQIAWQASETEFMGDDINPFSVSVDNYTANAIANAIVTGTVIETFGIGGAFIDSVTVTETARVIPNWDGYGTAYLVANVSASYPFTGLSGANIYFNSNIKPLDTQNWWFGEEVIRPSQIGGIATNWNMRIPSPSYYIQFNRFNATTGNIVIPTPNQLTSCTFSRWGIFDANVTTDVPFISGNIQYNVGGSWIPVFSNAETKAMFVDATPGTEILIPEGRNTSTMDVERVINATLNSAEFINNNTNLVLNVSFTGNTTTVAGLYNLGMMVKYKTNALNTIRITSETAAPTTYKIKLSSGTQTQGPPDILQYIRFTGSFASGNLLNLYGRVNLDIVMPDRASNVAGMATANVKLGNVSLGIIANALVASTVIDWTHLTYDNPSNIVGYSTLTLTSNAYISRSGGYTIINANVAGFSREDLRTPNGTGYYTYVGNGYGNVYFQSNIVSLFTLANATLGIYGGYT